MQLGGKLTKGLGAGANPEVGRERGARGSEIDRRVLEGADMVFITAGLGGGTGTGAAPIIASLAKELGSAHGRRWSPSRSRFEGKQAPLPGRGRASRSCATSSTRSSPSPTSGCSPSWIAARRCSRRSRSPTTVLRQAVQGISDLITVPGLINLDFADVRTIMSGMGMALMGTGSRRGEHRALDAAQQAISSPLLDDTSIEGATRHPDQHHRRPRPDAFTRWTRPPASCRRPRTRRPTSSSARSSTRA